MPPKAKSNAPIEDVSVPLLEGDKPSGAVQDADPPISEHEPKVLVEASDVKDEPVKTSGAVPVTVTTTEGLDEGKTVETVVVNHPVYGMISLADLEEVIRADVEAKREREKSQQDQDAAAPCDICFPQGWESANAVDQDGVTCQHGAYNRTRVKE